MADGLGRRLQAPITSLTWGHNDRRLFVATGAVILVACVSRRIPSLQHLSRLRLRRLLDDPTQLERLPMPRPLRNLVRPLFSSTVHVSLTWYFIFNTSSSIPSIVSTGPFLNHQRIITTYFTVYTGVYSILPSFTGFLYQVLPSLTRFHRVFIMCYRVLPGFTEYNRVLQSVIRLRAGGGDGLISLKRGSLLCEKSRNECTDSFNGFGVCCVERLHRKCLNKASRWMPFEQTRKWNRIRTILMAPNGLSKRWRGRKWKWKFQRSIYWTI